MLTSPPGDDDALASSETTAPLHLHGAVGVVEDPPRGHRLEGVRTPGTGYDFERIPASGQREKGVDRHHERARC